MPDQILHLLTNSVFILREEILSFNNSHFLRFLEGMLKIAQCEENTPQHPNINFEPDVPLLKSVDHLRGPIHHCSELFIVFKFLNDFICSGSLVEERFCTAGSKIAQSKILARYQDVFNFDVSMSNWRRLRMHIANSLCHLIHNMDDLSLAQYPIVLLKQIE
jgi:hypothetical protein